MSLPYQVLGPYTASIDSGSFLDANNTSLFYVSQSSDIWFGLSTNDVIEISSFSENDQTQEGWNILYQDKNFQTSTLTYLDNLNIPNTYSYNQLINPYTMYGNQKILLQPYNDLSNIGITSSNHIVSYNFTREMAGNIASLLTIKDISTSRTEIKLIAKNNLDIQYNSFCVKKFPIKDVVPILLTISKDLPYDSIYQQMNSMDVYQNGINFLKSNFFLTNDGSVVEFMREMYEDVLKYTSIVSDVLPTKNQPFIIVRIQGIKTYYTNYLLQNNEQIADFNDIRNNYIDFVQARVVQRFNQFKNITDQGLENAIQFCYDFFITYFYDYFVNPLNQSYQQKYFGLFKNVLNFGNNEYFPILTHNYLDERISADDPLTLIVKMATGLPSNISIRDTCWVSNFGMVPYIFTATIQNPILYKTTKISGPNFNASQNLINQGTSNVLYSSDDLTNSTTVQNDIQINKNIAELNTDYSNYSNFVVFSSAQVRLNIFKNKIVQWTQLTFALNELNIRYSSSLSSSIPYPYYSTEQITIESQLTDLINSFDGFESYLFNSGNYSYNLYSGLFNNQLYVSNLDMSASLYDKNNRDNLLSNAPEYVVNDPNNQDYLTFLSMIGHHFDNIYTYISALPINKQVKNQLNSSIPSSTLKEMLYSFGWNVDDVISSLDLDTVYLNSLNSSSYDSLSGQQRLQTIWNRILVTLPAIYKTKGTVECVNYLMACYGLPTSMISIREYGGVDYANDTSPTYILDEKTYMLTFSGVGDYIEGPIPYTTHTVEFKFSVVEDANKVLYPDFKFFPLFTSIPNPYTDISASNWNVGFYRIHGKDSGQIIFQLGSGSSQAFITSSTLPIFNGDIFSVMIRRNNPFYLFEPESGSNNIPLEYDLTVQRNERGRTIFYSTSSMILYENDNSIFSQFGRFRLTNGNFHGTLDKLLIWDVPIDDDDFTEHVDDINSYGYSGSVAYQDLFVRLFWDYPQNMYSGSGKVWIDNQSPYYFIPNYYTDGTLTTVNPTLYSASLSIRNNVWLSSYPTGSTDIIGYNFPPTVDGAFSSSFVVYPGCYIESKSVYPYHFQELTYEQNIDASKFGPTKYKNNKIKKLDYSPLETRLDSFNRSTIEPSISVSGESNQLGFFIDPQDSKNKDILRYVGKSGVMELIGDPSNLYSDKYYDLVNKNYEYNTNGDKQTFFNELLTVYKFYFDKSIFSAIKNIIPARVNAYLGVVIEPTLLERPKYQNKPITASLQTDVVMINNLYHLSESCLWTNFNFDPSTTIPGNIPPNYQEKLNFSTYPIRIWPKNIGNISTDYYADIDDIQHNFYPDFEGFPRLWETSSTIQLNSTNIPIYAQPIYGSVTHTNGNKNGKNDGRFLVGTHHGVNYTNNYVDVNGGDLGYFTGVNTGSHQILYYMIKVWERHYYYSKSGDYVRSTNLSGKKHSTYNFRYNGEYYYTGSDGNIITRTENPGTDIHDSASFYLYKYIIVDEYYMRNLIYFTDGIYVSPYNPNDVSSTQPQIPGFYNYSGTSVYYPNGIFSHKVNTFINTPDQMVNNVEAINVSLFPLSFNVQLFDNSSQYFELARGYPRNHFTHKGSPFSKTKYGMYNHQIYVKMRNSDPDAFYSSFTYATPVIYTNPVILTVPSPTAGQITITSTKPQQPTKPVITLTPDQQEAMEGPGDSNGGVFNNTMAQVLQTLSSTPQYQSFIQTYGRPPISTSELSLYTTLLQRRYQISQSLFTAFNATGGRLSATAKSSYSQSLQVVQSIINRLPTTVTTFTPIVRASTSSSSSRHP